MLCEFARNTRDIVQGKVFMPKLNEIIDATKESQIFQVIHCEYEEMLMTYNLYNCFHEII